MRRFEAIDVDFGLSLCRAASWNQLREDWETFLSLRPDGAFVATLDGALAGTVTTLEFGDADYGWIGMLLVAPEKRRRGVASKLLDQALQSLSHCTTIGLDATEDGRQVYLKRGFRDHARLHRWVRQPAPVRANRCSTPRDLSDAVRLDRSAFGAGRSEFLKRLAPRSSGLIWIDDEVGRGFAASREGFRYAHIGPVVASNLSAATELLRTALKRFETRPIAIDAFDRDLAWTLALKDLGFVRERALVRMLVGDEPSVEHPERAWASAGPEFG